MEKRYIIVGNKKPIQYNTYHEAEKVAKWIGVSVTQIKEVHFHRR